MELRTLLQACGLLTALAWGLGAARLRPMPIYWWLFSVGLGVLLVPDDRLERFGLTAAKGFLATPPRELWESIPARVQIPAAALVIMPLLLAAIRYMAINSEQRMRMVILSDDSGMAPYILLTARTLLAWGCHAACYIAVYRLGGGGVPAVCMAVLCAVAAYCHRCTCREIECYAEYPLLDDYLLRGSHRRTEEMVYCLPPND